MPCVEQNLLRGTGVGSEREATETTAAPLLIDRLVDRQSPAPKSVQIPLLRKPKPETTRSLPLTSLQPRTRRLLERRGWLARCQAAARSNQGRCQQSLQYSRSVASEKGTTYTFNAFTRLRCSSWSRDSTLTVTVRKVRLCEQPVALTCHGQLIAVTGTRVPVDTQYV